MQTKTRRLNVWEKMLVDHHRAGILQPKFAHVIRNYSRMVHPFWNYRAHGNVLRWHKAQTKYRALLGGNRSGKTYGASFEVASRLLGINPWHRVPRPCKGLCVVPGFEQVGQVTWPSLKPFLEGYWIESATGWNDRKKGRPSLIRVRSWCKRFVSELHFMSDDQDTSKFSGPTWDFVWFDEHFSDDVFTEAAIRGTVDRNGIGFVTLTPIQPFPWLQAQEESDPPNWAFIHRSTHENRISKGGHLADAYVDDLWTGFLTAYGPDVATARFEGLWYGLTGLCYPYFSRAKNVVEPFEVPEWWHRYVGIDFGWSNPFACLWIAHDWGANEWYVVDEYHEEHTLYRNHAKAITNETRPWALDQFCQIIADSEDAQGRAELRELIQRPIGLQNKKKKSVKRGIEQVSQLITDGKVKIFSHCHHTIREHQKYRWHETRDEPVKEDDHTCDALRGVIFTVANPVVGEGGSEVREAFEKPRREEHLPTRREFLDQANKRSRIYPQPVKMVRGAMRRGRDTWQTIQRDRRR